MENRESISRRSSFADDVYWEGRRRSGLYRRGSNPSEYVLDPLALGDPFCGMQR